MGQLTRELAQAEARYEFAKETGMFDGTFSEWIREHEGEDDAVKTPQPAEIVPGVRYSHGAWTQLLSTSFAEIEKLATLKGGEYSGDDDRLANFRRNAVVLGLTMKQVWAVYAAKHWDAVMQSIKDEQNKINRTRLESLSSRVDDLLVYLLLFKAMLEESGLSEG